MECPGHNFIPLMYHIISGPEEVERPNYEQALKEAIDIGIHLFDEGVRELANQGEEKTLLDALKRDDRVAASILYQGQIRRVDLNTTLEETVREMQKEGDPIKVLRSHVISCKPKCLPAYVGHVHTPAYFNRIWAESLHKEGFVPEQRSPEELQEMVLQRNTDFLQLPLELIQWN